MMTGQEIENARLNQLSVGYTNPENPKIVYTGRIAKCLFDKLWFMGKNADKKVIVGCLAPLSEQETREAKKALKYFATTVLSRDHFSLPEKKR